MTWLPKPKRMVWIAALVVVLNGFFPAMWILLTSVKTESELMRLPITIWPAAPTFDNYIRVFVDQPILVFLFNSFMVAMFSTLLCVTVSACAAYALVRLRVPAPNLILSILLAVAMFPLISLMVPLFQTMRALELLNTWPAHGLADTQLAELQIEPKLNLPSNNADTQLCFQTNYYARLIWSFGGGGVFSPVTTSR